jgi:hypothetical protein
MGMKVPAGPGREVPPTDIDACVGVRAANSLHHVRACFCVFMQAEMVGKGEHAYTEQSGR